MIGSIRKHSKWLWWVIAGLTIVSFVFFMGSGPARNSHGGGGPGSYGTIYGHEITAEEVAQARSDYYIYFLVSNGEWPDKNPSVSKLQLEQQIYLNLLLMQKAKSLGVAVPDEVVADAAAQMLRSPALTRLFGSSGQPVPPDQFVERLLKPKGLNAADFQSAVRAQLVIEQLRMTLGLSGSLVTPQEAGALYERERSEVSASAVFFSLSNYLAQIYTTPAEVAQFYTNNMAYYRLPERLQVNYVFFNVTNHLADAVKKLTNLTALVELNYKKYGSAEEFKKLTPEAAKAKIGEIIIRQAALEAAAVQATEFVKVLWPMEPVKPENIVTLAKQKNLAVKLSAPFSAEGMTAADFANAPAVEREAFKLNAESPFSGAVPGEDGIYVIGMANQLPSSIPPFAEIAQRVAQDLRTQQADALAIKAGTNFYFNASVQVAAGKTFAQAAVAAGLTPVILSPFSLSSAEVPEAAGVDIRALKQAAFSTPVGGVSRFMPTADGGFVLHVDKISPADPAKKAADMPQVLSQIRRGRENEAFSIWVNNEANREFRNIAAFQKLQSEAANQP